MGLKICKECGEQVDGAKAFCPDCGNPFVEEEEREDSSEFDDYAGTMNFSRSVHKMVLSEMELDTSKDPDSEQQQNQQNTKDDLIKSIPPIMVKSQKIKLQELKAPQKPLPKDKVSENNAETEPGDKTAGINKVVIFAVVGGLVLFVLVTSVLLIALYIYYSNS